MFPSYAWKYPTTDSLRIRVRDLLNHTAGFATDGLWFDRQTPMPEPAFSQRFGCRGLNA
jgi:CubicO group peptidase (beta-lactamase class C family)